MGIDPNPTRERAEMRTRTIQDMLAAIPRIGYLSRAVVFGVRDEAQAEDCVI